MIAAPLPVGTVGKQSGCRKLETIAPVDVASYQRFYRRSRIACICRLYKLVMSCSG